MEQDTVKDRLVWEAGNISVGVDHVAVETPIAMVYNGLSHAVMMATPDDLGDFALGFSLSEGIIDSSEQFLGYDETKTAKGIELNIDIVTGRFEALKQRRRSLVGRTGCGLCGIESLEQAIPKPSSIESAFQISHGALDNALATLTDKQVLQKQTGAVHAAAWCNEDGEVQFLREDIGRHNALDKLLGAINKLGKTEGFVLVTSRASYEMVYKVASANVAILASVSAPTSLAIELADQCRLTLIAFTRQGRHVVYAGLQRLVS